MESLISSITTIKYQTCTINLKVKINLRHKKTDIVSVFTFLAKSKMLSGDDHQHRVHDHAQFLQRLLHVHQLLLNQMLVLYPLMVD